MPMWDQRPINTHIEGTMTANTTKVINYISIIVTHVFKEVFMYGTRTRTPTRTYGLLLRTKL